MKTTGGAAESEAERAAATLRDQIVDGERLPGSRLVERDLAAELGVSRLPIREALRALTNEGLVTPRPRTWAVVREFSEQDIDDLQQVRAALEPLAFAGLAATRTAEDLKRLRAILARHAEAASRGDVAASHREAAAFHTVALELSPNGLVGEVGALLASRLRWMLSQHDDLLAVTDEHEELYAAIEAGDPERARALAEEHLVSSARRAEEHGRAAYVTA
ncbi:GntR family transcriptional regulator [Galactobacter valiniphilus]|uniref:GntR family transcriptional regulator n=1 Tax=Galactobacter valiniphilus TaxID=2676122 RepID=A0A399JBE2_9MICC|nr:GntR family transcriptional regulator [Galactobacter valiniphilus]RII42534.1 GntR family transcriptional regulator [Galactobacter valiniphilus]